MPLVHAWNLSPKEAVALQKALASSVREVPLNYPVRTVAGVDVSIKNGLAHAAVVVLEAPEYIVVDQATDRGRVEYPYVPGLLAFREIPPILRALNRLSTPFEVLMTDGHGRVHPRRFGLACHLGVLLDMPAVGVAKRPYVGVHGVLPLEKGATAPLTDAMTEEVLGMAVRTRRCVKPVYASVGHRVMLSDAVGLTIDSALHFRLPEPTRQAHLLSRRTFR